MLAPVGDGEQVGVGDSKAVAQQEGLALELLVDILEAAQQALAVQRLALFGHARVEQGRETLVQLGGDEVEPLDQAITRHRAGGRGQVAGGHLVGDVLHDGRAFGQALAVVQLQQRHIAFGVDAVVVGAIGQLVGLGAGEHSVELQAGLVENDVRAQ